METATKNTYQKYCPNVFVAKCSQEQTKGDTIILTTKRGKENESIVHNFLGKTADGCFLYSITRADGFNHQERAKRKAEKLKSYSSNAEKRSDEFYQASKEGKDFLSLGEPIKIGHHSENRHRKLIERNWDRMRKSVEESEKAEDYRERAEYWKERADKINLSQPESLEYFRFKLEEAKKNHQRLKDNPKERQHAYSLTYAKKSVNEAEKNLNTAIKLWGSTEEIQQVDKEKEEEAKAKAMKKSSFDNTLKKYGGFFFFGSDVKVFRERHAKLIEQGYLEQGEKVKHIFAGLYVPSKHADAFIKEM